MKPADPARAWPTRLAFRRKPRDLRIDFDDGARFDIPFELLRVESPSAETRGHGAGPPPALGGKKSVGVLDAQPVGRYAVRIVFDDGHQTGLYTWPFLYELGRDAKARLKAHEARLKAAGLSR